MPTDVVCIWSRLSWGLLHGITCVEEFEALDNLIKDILTIALLVNDHIQKLIEVHHTEDIHQYIGYIL